MHHETYTHRKSKGRNIATVLRLVCTGQAGSRAELTRLTGLSKMTITNIVASLLAEGYLCEIDRSTPGVSQGRKPVVIEVSPTAPCVVGVYIGRATCSVVASTIGAKIIKEAHIDLHTGITGRQLLEKLYALYKKCTAHLDRRILGIGIACIGPIDIRQGIILNPPDFYSITDLPVKAYFAEKTGLPIFMDNNMNASVLAEKLFGYGKELSSILYLGVTHGVGAGIITGGKLLESPGGVNGETGHMSINFDGPACQCGARGCLELYASIPRIVESAVAEMESQGIQVEKSYSWNQLVEDARGGEFYAQRALGRLGEFLSVGIVNLVNILDCEEIYLGHEIALAKGLIEEEMEQIVNSRILASSFKHVRVRMSCFGQQAPLVGSACLVLNQLFNGEDQSHWFHKPD